MNKRIALIRKDSGLNQQMFADRIGLTKNFVSLLETGNRLPSDRTIADICREFGVREEWLRIGKLPMYQPVSRNQSIKDFVDDAMAAESSDFRQRLLAVLAKLDTKEWELLEAMALKLAADAQAEKPYKLKIAGRDGSVQELDMTDEEKEAFKDQVANLPGPPDDL